MKKIIWIGLFASSLYADISKGKVIAHKVNTVIGVNYTWGGNNIKTGLDCSALVQQVYKRFGYQVPRTAAAQATQTNECPMIKDLKKTKIGDALYFKNEKGKIHHVAFITGYNKNGRPVITHAKGKDFGVIRETMSDKYISEFIGAKRFYNCEPVKKKIRDRYLKPLIIKTALR